MSGGSELFDPFAPTVCSDYREEGEREFDLELWSCEPEADQVPVSGKGAPAPPVGR